MGIGSCDMHCRVVKRLLSILRIGHREQVEEGRERGRMSYNLVHVFVKYLEMLCLFTIFKV